MRTRYVPLFRAFLLMLAVVIVFAATSSPTRAQEPITLRMWVHQNDGFNAGYQALIDAYVADNPGVNIELEVFPYSELFKAIQTSLPAGNAADILQMFGTAACGYAQGGQLATVPEGVLTLDQSREMFYSAPIEGFVCPGENGEALYGVPQEFNIEYGAALVNRRIADEVGVQLPDPLQGWATWDDLFTSLSPLTEGDGEFMTRAGLHFTNGDPLVFTFLSLIAQQGGEYYDAETRTFNFDTPEAHTALQLIVDMTQKHNLVNPELFSDSANPAPDAFANGQAAAIILGPWVVPCCVTSVDATLVEDIDYIKLPSLGDEPTFKADSGWGLVVTSASPAQEQAWEFIQYVTLNQDNALAWNIASGTLPAIRANVEDEARLASFTEPQPWIAPLLEIFPYGEFIGHFPNRDQIFYEIILPNVLSAMSGTQSVDDTLATITSQANSSQSN
jgi:multiple sugar transport system substrate-binding protein